MRQKSVISDRATTENPMRDRILGAAFRAFDGPEWRIKHAADHGQRADIVVSVIGLQYADGHALCKIIIDCPDTPVVTSAEALKLAGALIAAAGAAEASGWA